MRATTSPSASTAMALTDVVPMSIPTVTSVDIVPLVTARRRRSATESSDTHVRQRM